MKTILHIPFVSWALAIAWATIVWGGIALSLTSCSLIEGTLYCAHKTPKAIEQWWNDQQP